MQPKNEIKLTKQNIWKLKSVNKSPISFFSSKLLFFIYIYIYTLHSSYSFYILSALYLRRVLDASAIMEWIVTN